MRAALYTAVLALLGFSLAGSIHQHGIRQSQNQRREVLLAQNVLKPAQKTTSGDTSMGTTFYGEATRTKSAPSKPNVTTELIADASQ